MGAKPTCRLSVALDFYNSTLSTEAYACAVADGAGTGAAFDDDDDVDVKASRSRSSCAICSLMTSRLSLR